MDDANWASVDAAIAYYLNFPAYQRVREPAITRHGWKDHLAFVKFSQTEHVVLTGSTIFTRSLAQKILPAGLFGLIYRQARYPSMIAIKKIAEDARDWNWSV